MVRKKGDFLSSKVCGEMVHAPDGCLHFKEKWGVIAFMLLQFSACISNDTMFAIGVDLREDCAEAAGLFVVAKASIDN